MFNNKERFKVVYQCSGCDNPICDGDHFVKTPYGYFCDDCVTDGYAEFHEEASLDDLFDKPIKQVEKLTAVWTEVNDESAWIWDRHKFVCSQCGCSQTYGKTKFCHNCGAKMKTEAEAV